jgi:hypothetical protein
LALAGATAACGQGGGASVATSGKPMSAAALASAGARTAGLSTYRADLTMSVAMSSAPTFTLHGTGMVDRTDRMASITMDMSGFASAMSAGASASGDMQEVMAGGHIYMHWSALTPMLPAGKSWIELTDLSKVYSAVSGSSPSTPTDASSYLQLLRGISGGVTVVGTEPIDGTPTTHYRADVEMSKALARLPTDVPADVKAAVGHFGGGTIPVELWVDSSGLVRQVEMTIDVGQLTKGAVSGSERVTETLSHFGEPIDISTPPPEVVDQVSSLSALTGGH